MHVSARPLATHALSIFGDQGEVMACRCPTRPTRSAPPAPSAVFFGLGSDGTVGTNKNSIKTIAENTGLYAQGYVRLRLEEVGRPHHLAPGFSPSPIRAPCPTWVNGADFVACHHFVFFAREADGALPRCPR